MKTNEKTSVAAKNKVDRENRCPELLAEILGLINLVPAEKKWPKPEDLLKQAGGDPQRFAKLVKTELPELRGVFRKRNNRPVNAIVVYRKIFILRALLRSIATIKPKLYETPATLTFPYHPAGVEATIRFEIDGETKRVRLGASDDEILKIVLGIDARYVGGCAVCQRLFWRRRRDARACDDCGSGKLRHRRYRANEKRRNEEAKKDVATMYGTTFKGKRK